MDIINNIISSLKAEKGQLTLNLDKKSMIESNVKNESDNHLEIRNKSIRIIVGHFNNNSFNLKFATTFVEQIDIEIEFEKQKEIELYFEWSDSQYKIEKNKTVISENNSLAKKFPGGSIQIDIKQMLGEKNNFQYILDIGEKEKLNSERISLYVDKEFNLILRVIDKKGKVFVVKQEKSKFWKPDIWLQVICSWNQKNIKIRTFMASNDQDYDEKKSISQGIDLFYMPINPPMIIGTDLTKKFFSKMTVSELKLFDKPII